MTISTNASSPLYNLSPVYPSWLRRLTLRKVKNPHRQHSSNPSTFEHQNLPHRKIQLNSPTKHVESLPLSILALLMDQRLSQIRLQCKEGGHHVLTLSESKYLLFPHSCACELQVVLASLVVGGILWHITYENAFVGTLALSREGVKHCLNCECAMTAWQMCLYNKSLNIYMIL